MQTEIQVIWTDAFQKKKQPQEEAEIYQGQAHSLYFLFLILLVFLYMINLIINILNFFFSP